MNSRIKNTLVRPEVKLWLCVFAIIGMSVTCIIFLQKRKNSTVINGENICSPDSVSLDDQLLISSVAELAAYRVHPNEVSIIFRRKPAMEFVIFDESQSRFFREFELINSDLHMIGLVKSARYIMYWYRPINLEQSHIIGLAWDKFGIPKMFWGELAVPGAISLSE